MLVNPYYNRFGVEGFRDTCILYFCYNDHIRYQNRQNGFQTNVHHWYMVMWHHQCWTWRFCVFILLAMLYYTNNPQIPPMHCTSIYHTEQFHSMYNYTRRLVTPHWYNYTLFKIQYSFKNRALILLFPLSFNKKYGYLELIGKIVLVEWI